MDAAKGGMRHDPIVSRVTINYIVSRLVGLALNISVKSGRVWSHHVGINKSVGD